MLLISSFLKSLHLIFLSKSLCLSSTFLDPLTSKPENMKDLSQHKNVNRSRDLLQEIFRTSLYCRRKFCYITLTGCFDEYFIFLNIVIKLYRIDVKRLRLRLAWPLRSLRTKCAQRKRATRKMTRCK